MGVAIGAPGHEDLRGDGRGQLRFADPGQRLGDRRVRGQDDRLGGHHRAGRTGEVVQQPADRIGLLRLHQVQQYLLIGLGQLGQQVGGVVGVHLLQDVGGPPRRQRRDDLHLVVFGQLLQDVGQPFVVQGRGHLEAPAVGQILEHVGHVSRAHVVEYGQQVGRALRVSGQRQPFHHVPVEDVDRASAPDPAALAAYRDLREHPVAGTCALHRHVGDRRRFACLDEGDPTVEQLSDDQRLRLALGEAAQAHRAGRDHRTGLDTGDAGHRQEDRAARWHLDDEAEDPGLFSPGRSMTMTSRTRPTWSPFGSNTTVPARRATKTLDGGPLMSGGYPRRRRARAG